MNITIIDCYTDEPSGFGVPPYMGVYPRYLAGFLKKKYPQATITFLTIDDIRYFDPTYIPKKVKPGMPKDSDIFVLNRTGAHVPSVLKNTDQLYTIVGVQVPGKYLSAVPGTFKEITTLLERYGIFRDVSGIKKHSLDICAFAGPAMSEFGTQVQGGKFAEAALKIIDKTMENIQILCEDFFIDYSKLNEYAVLGAQIITPQFPKPCIVEMETSRGCYRTKNCSFCTEPLSDRQSFREQMDIVSEMKTFYDLGIRHFRFGRQTCFFSYKRHNAKELEQLFELTWKAMPDIKVLHIDNVDPVRVITPIGIEMTKLTVKYCTPGNIAPFGVETFDAQVCKKNDLNSYPQTSMRAIQIINEHGKERGENGMPKLLPGINILFGLIGESKQTHQQNMEHFSQIVKNDWWLRRINIRQVVPYYGTKLYAEAKNKFIKKNKQYYFSWRRQIREEIDQKLLEQVFPVGIVIKDCMAEVHKRGVTYFRQLATYPIIIGVKGEYDLKKFYDIKITDNMLRSLKGEVVQLSEDQFEAYPKTYSER
ncbi:MAG: hypothetical protein ACMXYF_02730 [Candidatus Woesearchaeota archaeon]